MEESFKTALQRVSRIMRGSSDSSNCNSIETFGIELRTPPPFQGGSGGRFLVYRERTFASHLCITLYLHFFFAYFAYFAVLNPSILLLIVA